MLKNVIIGLSGSIAAYKIPGLIRLLGKEQIKVSTVLTKNARYFVTETTLASLTGTLPLTDDTIFHTAHIPHLSVVENPSVLVIAPATANIIAKCAHGLADDLLSTIFLAYQGPKLIVPAMHTEMYLNAITQENIARLMQDGVHFLGPAQGALASGGQGPGRQVDIELILQKVLSLGYPQLALRGRKILITCGGTREKLDKVRFLTNASSGKLGSALANLASFMGADVTVITTVPLADNPHLRKVIYVESAEQMRKAVLKEIKTNQVLYMAAAVADYTLPASQHKIRRQASLNLELSATPDILQALAPYKKGRCLIGFCLEDRDLAQCALAKLQKKNLDYIVANGSEAINADRRDATIFSAKSTPPIKLKKATVLSLAYQLLKLIA